MDVNANMLPVTPAANSAKESPRDKQIDENQAPALPFQAMLENQQSPEKNSENSPTLNGSANETPLNQQISEQKQSEATTVASDKPAPETLATDKPVSGEAQLIEKQQAENTLAQLNFRRDLNAQSPLQADLLTGKQGDEQALVNQLKQAMDERIQAATHPQISADKPSATPFTQTLQQLSDVARNVTPFDDKTLAGAQLQLAGEESELTLPLMGKKEVGERRDQALFALDNPRAIPTKDLNQDAMSLGKKTPSTESLSQIANAAADNTLNLQNSAKGAFNVQAESGAFNNTATPSVTHVAGIMATPSATPIPTTAPAMPTPTMNLAALFGTEAWQQQLSQQMLFFSRQGVSQAQIRLHPEELGSLNVHLRIEDNQAVMHFVSPHSHVRAAMESMMPVLRSALQESGIHLAQGSVGQDSFSGQSGSDQQSRQHDGQIQPTHPSMGVVGISESHASMSGVKLPTHQGGINTFA
ncbi:flagellar hook-length control protein FliK [Providencia alcalifaciens]|uniref:flagellar hook-length control protein FliK n=1 Tax=Providencia alcalifaciens TaxID=126385 RepID=UPI00044C3D5F|nr:flagellar hook-length control protein FliK [Providencia alcalifaciens]ETT03728.1 flagellar hook-length control protein FliK [Providencia alcalifaciens F90-2004]EUC95248.1 flagellar hook-length control protein FliK [Providencia alcalifaciens PAL-2]MTB34499.1 flagellar hook-length control protein FliK [Providencia alcalifaciens]MTC99879.1 flagellar hook-length control protein FliK [Providencia alcalifaciens]